MAPVKEYDLKLLEVIQETPEVNLFRFEHPQDGEFYFYPGQFMMVSFIDEHDIKYGRAYSLTSSPENKSYIEIGLDKVAKFTEKMFSLHGGEILRLKGPYGKFYFNEELRKDIVLIGGGTGITPLMSIIRYGADKSLPNRMRLIYSVRSPGLAVYQNEFEGIKKRNKNFEYAITVTRETEESKWSGRMGRIDVGMLRECIVNINESAYFLCGPSEFVKNIIDMLYSLGVSKEQIRIDIWG